MVPLGEGGNLATATTACARSQEENPKYSSKAAWGQGGGGKCRIKGSREKKREDWGAAGLDVNQDRGP